MNNWVNKIFGWIKEVGEGTIKDSEKEAEKIEGIIDSFWSFIKGMSLLVWASFIKNFRISWKRGVIYLILIFSTTVWLYQNWYFITMLLYKGVIYLSTNESLKRKLDDYFFNIYKDKKVANYRFDYWKISKKDPNKDVYTIEYTWYMEIIRDGYLKEIREFKWEATIDFKNKEPQISFSDTYVCPNNKKAITIITDLCSEQ